MHTENISAAATKIAVVSGGATLAKVSEAAPMMILGLSLSDWAAGLTAIYVIFQGIVIFPAVVRTVKGWVARFRAWRSAR